MTPAYPAKTFSISGPAPGGLLGVVYGMERVIAVAALLLLSPLALIIALAIFALSRRSPLVSHTRVGWRGAPLPMLKFRTMWTNGQLPGPLLAIENVSGSVPASKGVQDSRVTSRFAAFCRRYSLDELPQFYHVAQGQMSFVGPRPVTLAELRNYYGDAADEVVSLRPGLTGLWQIAGRNRLTYAERKRLDLLFVRSASAGLYFSILLRSIPKVLSGNGAF
jgi:exopolysaccharide production protein ExoY